MNKNGCLSVTQITGYNSHPGPWITGKLKGHKFIGICQEVEIDKNNTCLILSVLCKDSECINLLGGLFSLPGFVSVGCFWAACGLKEKRQHVWNTVRVMYGARRPLLLRHLFTFNTQDAPVAADLNCLKWSKGISDFLTAIKNELLNY